MAEMKPNIPYWHVYVDADAVSRQELFEIAEFELKGINAQTQPQWNDKMDQTMAGVTFTVLPVGWVGDWHENPKPQWITILTGRWFVETMDGHRVEMGPGETMMGEDQNTKARDGKKGSQVGHPRRRTLQHDRRGPPYRPDGRSAGLVPVIRRVH